jgi:o-succinylbenzoate---CoA ligase
LGVVFYELSMTVFDALEWQDSQRASIGEYIYELFSQRLQAGWLVGSDGVAVIDRANQKLAEFTQSQPNFISIATPDPILLQSSSTHEFIANLMAGSRLGIPIFFCNPRWGTAEWEQVSSLTTQVDRQQHQQTMMIPTGGSSGKIKFVIHTWETLSASVWGFQEFYELENINSVCMLPLYHVSGLIQLVRSLLTDGKLVIIDFHQLCNAPTALANQIDLVSGACLNDNRYFISLVPTQLSKLLDLNSNWLTQFQTILLGGAPPSVELLNSARIARLPLALTYGMTETASQITSLKPAEFLAGNNSCGRVLPHVEIQLRASTDDRTKSIRIKAKSLMLGYFPNLDRLTYFEPDDLGSFDLDGYLTILGRNSGKIITGGENVFPIEVVNVIMLTGLVADVWVVGLPDRYWGQVVAAIYVDNHHPVSAAILTGAIAGKVSNYKIPKYWVPVAQIPRNSLGKVLIQEVAEIVRIEIDRLLSMS